MSYLAARILLIMLLVTSCDPSDNSSDGKRSAGDKPRPELTLSAVDAVVKAGAALEITVSSETASEYSFHHATGSECGETFETWHSIVEPLALTSLSGLQSVCVVGRTADATLSEKPAIISFTGKDPWTAGVEISWFTANSVRVRLTAATNDEDHAPAVALKYADGATITADLPTDGSWTKITGLKTATTYEVSVQGFHSFDTPVLSHASVRTLALNELLMAADGVGVSGSDAFVDQSCFGWSTLRYNTANGRLQLFGQGVYTSYGQPQCYGEYDGRAWSFLRLPFSSGTAGLDWNTDAGHTTLADGTLYAVGSKLNASNQTVSVLLRCKESCSDAASWTSYEFPGSWFSSGIAHTCRQNLKLNAQRNMLVKTAVCGMTSYSECSLANGATCMEDDDWTYPTVLVANGGVSWGEGKIYIDSQGGLWMPNENGSFSGVSYCSPTSDCTNPAKWKSGGMVAGQQRRMIVSTFFEEGGSLRFMSQSTNSEYLVGSCSLASRACGNLTGGVFTNFNATNSWPAVFTQFGVTNGARTTNVEGWGIHTLPVADGFAQSLSQRLTDSGAGTTIWTTYIRACKGTFGQCSNATTNWGPFRQRSVGFNTGNVLREAEGLFATLVIGADMRLRHLPNSVDAYLAAIGDIGGVIAP